uniref:Beta-carotene 3-hydroxylase, chloroplastic n=1 Tax=Oncidium hybrid cultivar TaxID=141207 RepID=BCH_ONCHC|nr:RecName: Full=Beta-carotene 3-hydroxylase, chloroplastic; Short=OgHYB; AltName: Full=Beta-carotene hydroxylase; Flags: Precursor [Oncidium hybrid cultivar]ACP27626.1 beta-carotene hydroxylase [Oncidium hybrid cultivar]
MAFAMSSSLTLFQYQSFGKKPFFSRRRDFAGCSMMNPLVARCNRATEICCVVRKDGEAESLVEAENDQLEEEVMKPTSIDSFSVVLRSERKKAERRTYLVAAMASSLGFTFMAAAAVYYRFAWQMEGGAVPLTEMMGTFSLAVGSAVGMEYWARWAHRALWHTSLWHMHESHHRPRDGPFELNDVFALINAFPAVALLAFGFFHRGFFSGLCFGAGLGITLYGMAYMFVHDGLVHRRFPVGPIATVPYFQWVAAAHQIHHADKFNGVPYGLFLGHKELEEVGGMEALEREIKRGVKVFSSSPNQS